MKRKNTAKHRPSRSHARTLVIATPHGWIRFADQQAQRWLATYFPPWSRGRLRRLPHALARWLTDVAPMGRPHTTCRDGKRLTTVLLHPTAHASVCLLLHQSPTERRLRRWSRVLTSREGEVMALLERGKTNGEIGRVLHLKIPTVKKHLENIYRKLGVENRTAAVNLLRDRRDKGLISVQDFEAVS